MNDARRKAEQLASLAEASLGAVVTIDETSDQPPVIYSRAAETACSQHPFLGNIHEGNFGLPGTFLAPEAIIHVVGRSVGITDLLLVSAAQNTLSGDIIRYAKS